jgi:hypothetical protein
MARAAGAAVTSLPVWKAPPPSIMTSTTRGLSWFSAQPAK